MCKNLLQSISISRQSLKHNFLPIACVAAKKKYLYVFVLLASKWTEMGMIWSCKKLLIFINRSQISQMIFPNSSSCALLFLCCNSIIFLCTDQSCSWFLHQWINMQLMWSLHSTLTLIFRIFILSNKVGVIYDLTEVSVIFGKIWDSTAFFNSHRSL